MPLSDDDRDRLLRLAREALRRVLGGQGRPTPDEIGVELTPALAEPAAAFVSIYVRGDLRGCRGCLVATRPLWETVVDQTLHSALHDERFAPVRASELPDARLTISILGEPRPVASHAEIQLGRHGIILSRDGARAVFLPSVAPKMGWDLPTTLTHLALKAGLPGGAWHEGATFEVFEAEVVDE